MGAQEQLAGGHWAQRQPAPPERWLDENEQAQLANAREPAVGGSRGLLRHRSQPQIRPESAPGGGFGGGLPRDQWGERTEYVPFLNTLYETDALTRQVERSLSSLRELLTTPRRLERLEGAPRPPGASAMGARPLSALPARQFVRPPNVPEVPLPVAAGTQRSQSSYGPDDLDGLSYESGSQGESPMRERLAAPLEPPEPPAQPWRSGRSQGSSGRRNGTQPRSQRSTREEDRAELMALCAWLLRRYRSGSDACAALLGSGSRMPSEHFAKALVREGYPGRPAAASRALDWRGRGSVRGADLVALVDASASDSSDGCSTRTAGSERETGHVQAFFQRNKASTPSKAASPAERGGREARPLSAPAHGVRRQPRA